MTDAPVLASVVRAGTDPASPLDACDRARCACVARRMDAAQPLSLHALACMAVTLIGMAVDVWSGASGVIVLGIVFAAVALGLIERYLALRLRLDAGLFTDLAAGRIANLFMLDAGLDAIGVHRHAPRTLDERIAGCRMWWRRHLAVVVAQTALTLLAVVSS